MQLSAVRKLQLVVKDGLSRMRRFQRARAMFIKQYVGHYYRDMHGEVGDEPINMIYHVIRSLVPSLVMRNPVTQITTEVKDFKTYAYMHGLSLDRLNERLDMKNILRRAIVDSFFALGIVKTGLNASDSLLNFGDISVDPGQVYAECVDFDDFVFDPACKNLKKAAFVGHRSRVPRQLLLDNAGFDHDEVRKLPQSLHPDANKKAAALSAKGFTSQEMVELQDFVDIVELYVPEADSIVCIPDPEQYMSDSFISLKDFHGPKTGPYRYLTLSQPVPDNPYPVAPVGIWYDLHILCNRLMRKQMSRAEHQKTIIVVDKSAADQAEDMRDASDSEIIYGNPDSAKLFSTYGAEKGTDNTLSNLQVWFNYMSGNPDQVAGLQSSAETATQAAILEGNANVTLEDARSMIYDFAAGINSDLGWFLHYDPFIDELMIARRPQRGEMPEGIEPGQQIRLTPEQRRGEHYHFVYDIKPRSMTPIDPLILSKRVVEFATNIVPAIIMAAVQAIQIGIPFNPVKAITDLADHYDLADYVQDWFNDPEFANRVQLIMALGPQPEGKGLTMQGVRQNGGSPMTANFNASPLNQASQDLAGYMQSAVKGKLRGTPGSRGPAVEGL